jgi:hypothetical protein
VRSWHVPGPACRRASSRTLLRCRRGGSAVRSLPGALGEIEGLKVSLAGTEDKLAQIDATRQRRDQAVHLGMPAFPDIAGRSVPGPEGQQ